MKFSLRKGLSSVYLQYANSGGSIRAEHFEVEVANGTVILTFKLRPVDENQRADEDNLHRKEPVYAQILADVVVEALRTFRTKHSEARGLVFEILSRKKRLRFTVERIRDNNYFLFAKHPAKAAKAGQ